MSAGSQETRYGHLLTPIRDLAANWSVDIAGELEEYLLELEDLEISEPAHSQTNLQHLDYKGKGKGTLNFVEAALLIQGSVCVYSKKVEFLYKLLYQTLAAVSTKRKLKKGGKHASSVNEQGVDMDAIFAAEESEFLPLDDLLVEGKHSSINMRDEADSDDELAGFSGASTFAKEPFSFLHHDSGAQGAFRGSQNPVSNCEVDVNGALMLDESHVLAHGISGSGTIGSSVVLDALALSPMMEGGANDDFGAEDDGYIPMDDFEMEMDMPEPMEYGSPVGAGQGQGAYVSDDDSGSDSEEEEENEVDPWALLDPFDDSQNAHTHKPYRKLRTFNKPAAAATALARDGSQTSLYSYALADMLQLARSTRNRAWQALADAHAHTEAREWEDSAFGRRPDQTTRGPSALGTAIAAGAAAAADDVDDYGYDMPDFDYGESADENWGDAHAGDAGLDLSGIQQAAYAENDDELSRVSVEAYETMCKTYVEDYLRKTEAYFTATNLAKRVNDWESKLQPTLDLEAARPALDMVELGHTVLSRCVGATDDATEEEEEKQPQSQPATFKHVVAGCEPWEVCRRFLAVLQLTNEGKVSIEQGSCDGDTGFSMHATAQGTQYERDYRDTQASLCFASGSEEEEEVEKGEEEVGGSKGVKRARVAVLPVHIQTTEVKSTVSPRPVQKRRKSLASISTNTTHTDQKLIHTDQKLIHTPQNKQEKRSRRQAFPSSKKKKSSRGSARKTKSAVFTPKQLVAVLQDKENAMPHTQQPTSAMKVKNNARNDAADVIKTTTHTATRGGPASLLSPSKRKGLSASRI